MANKKIVMKDWNGTGWDELHPRTIATQVITSTDALFTTQAEKDSWNAKKSFSGNYADLTGKPTLGTVADKNTGTTSGTIPIIGADGKLPASVVPSTTVTSITGNAGTATKLQTARTISLTGDATGSTTFDGSANVSITVTVANKPSITTSATAPTAPKTGDFWYEIIE